MIKDVSRIHTNLYALAFGESNRFGKRSIHVPLNWGIESEAIQIPSFSRLCIDENVVAQSGPIHHRFQTAIATKVINGGNKR
jgi:hypothetical protein